MSKSEDKAVRVLNQAVYIAKNRIEQQNCDIDLLVKRCHANDDEIIELQRQVKFEKAERVSLEKKSQTSTFVMIVVLIMGFTSLGMNILTWQ